MKKSIKIFGFFLFVKMLAFFCFAGTVHAQTLRYDFLNYKPTLDTLYVSSGSPAESAYTINPITTTSGSERFISYEWDGTTITPVYYNYNNFNFATGATWTSVRVVNSLNLTEVVNNIRQSNASGNGSAFFNSGDGGNTAGPRGTIGNLYGDFILNGATRYSMSYGGGGALANDGVIENLTGDFIRNYIFSYYGSEAYGGAVYNGVNVSNAVTHINSIKGNFMENRVVGYSGEYSAGGAIANFRSIGNIEGDFINNYSSGTYDMGYMFLGAALGGAVYNVGDIGNIDGNFVANHVFGGQVSAGGAIANYGGSINNINGFFSGNYAEDISGGSYGGAIHNQRTIGSIDADFVGNFAGTSGGAISNGSLINPINFAVGVGSWNNANDNDPQNPVNPVDPAPTDPGNNIVIDSIKGIFAGNYVSGSGTGEGGAIYNSREIKSISGDFYNNYVNMTGNSAYAYGGAIANQKSSGNDVGRIGVISGNFIDNYAKVAVTARLALGGAIYTENSLKFVADNANYLLSGNYTEDYRGKIYNAIFVKTSTTSHSTLAFDLKNNGSFTFNDNISGGEVYTSTVGYANRYNINITGDGSGTSLIMNNDIINAGNVNVTNSMLVFGSSTDTTGGYGAFKPDADNSGAAVTSLFLDNASFNTANGYLENISLAGYKASGDSYWHLDVDPDAMASDELHVSGDVEGITKLIVYSSSGTDISGMGTIPFAYSENDTQGTQDSFSFHRMHGSPYIYDIAYFETGLDEKEWHLEMRDNGGPVVTPETVAHVGLHSVGLEQTRSMHRSVRNKVAANKFYVKECNGVYDEYFVEDAIYNVWANAIYYNSKYDNNVKWSSEIYGLEGGFDIQFNCENKIGLFASYRRGNYDFDGKGKYLASNIGSTTDIDSYIGGAYYRFDYKRFWIFAAGYGGLQKAEIKTDDGVYADTEGMQFGANAAIGYLIPLNSTGSVTLEPIIGVSYTQLDFDDIKDSLGKTATYDIARQTELELALKLEKIFERKRGHTKIYIQPGLLLPVTEGVKVIVNGIGKIDTYEDKLSGRLEVGGRHSLTEHLSLYGEADYTHGSVYDALGASLGISYSFGGINKDDKRKPCYVKKQKKAAIAVAKEEKAAEKFALPVPQESAGEIQSGVLSVKENEIIEKTEPDVAPAATKEIVSIPPEKTKEESVIDGNPIETAGTSEATEAKEEEDPVAPVVMPADFSAEKSGSSAKVNPEEPAVVAASQTADNAVVAVIVLDRIVKAYFDIDSYQLREKAKSELKGLAEEIVEAGYAKIVIKGHTDSTGSKVHNQVLSKNRAKSVAKFLIQNGIDETKIETEGFDFSIPAATNSTKEGRQKNRRAEVEVYK